jgi:hypothetical protein
MRDRKQFGAVAPDITIDEARALPTFFRVSKISRPDYSCQACREHSAESWVNGSACDEHKDDHVIGTLDAKDAVLALEVLRAGGNPEPAHAAGTLGFAQFAYRKKGAKAIWSETVRALTYGHDEPAAIAA